MQLSLKDYVPKILSKSCRSDYFGYKTILPFSDLDAQLLPFLTRLLYNILDSLRWEKFSFMIVGMTGIEGIGEFDTTRVTPAEKVLGIADRRRRNPAETKPRKESKRKTPVNPSSTKLVTYDYKGRLVKNIG